MVRRVAAARPVVMEGLREQLHRSKFELENGDIQKWIVGLFKGLRAERVHLVLLDDRSRLLADEAVFEGTFRTVDINLRKIVTCGINVGASAIVLMHNHPSGEAIPSCADIEETKRISYFLSSVEMRLDDHLIVAGNAVCSMKRGGYL